jgi:hypothetical protein
MKCFLSGKGIGPASLTAILRALPFVSLRRGPPRSYIYHRRKTRRNPIYLLYQSRKTIELLPAKPSLVHLHLRIEHGRDHARLRAQDVAVLVVVGSREIEDFGGLVERLVRQALKLRAVVEYSRLVA